MVETTSVREEKPKLSARDRLCLIQTINALPPTQFDELAFALNPPKGVVASNTAAQGTRSKDLLDWLEGSSGPGLAAADEVLQVLIPKATKTAPQPVAFVMSGKINSSMTSELRAYVELLKKKTGDNSIDIAFFQEGSIKLILNGSLEGLDKLQEMFEAGELSQLNIPHVEAVTPVDGNSQDARKARLIQALRLRWRASIINGARARDLASALDLASNIASDLDLASASNLSSYIASDLDLVLDRARDIACDIASNLAFSGADLSGANLSGANLRYINLRGVNLTGAKLTHADVTGTIFRDNPGLTEADKRDLQSRGAIIQDPPSLDVPTFVLR
jgi:uncharacterized protein YjbI with pentapeptide repeats